MGAQELDQEFERPTINPWRQQPTREQVRFARDLCRSELATPERDEALGMVPEMSRSEISTLISSLKSMRAQRLRKAPRTARWRLAPMTPRR